MHMNANIYGYPYRTLTLSAAVQFYLLYYSRKQQAVICDKNEKVLNGNTEACLPDTGCPKITAYRKWSCWGFIATLVHGEKSQTTRN